MFLRSLYKTALMTAGLITLFSAQVHACTPIPGVIYTAFGATAWGAFAFKSAIGIALIVLLKAFFFSRFSGFSFFDSFKYVFIANVFSSVPGFLALPVFDLFMMPFLFALQIGICYIPATRISEYLKIDRKAIVAIMVGCLYISNVIFMGISPHGIGMIELAITYWPLKIAASILAVSFGFLITTGYEEAIINAIRLHFNKDDVSYLVPVARANLYSLLIAVAIAAAIAIPQRLQTENFLLYGLKAAYRFVAALV